MKKLQLLLLVLVLVAVASCKKESVNQTSDAPKYVKAIDGKFIAKDGDITFKSSPVGVNRTWTMYARSSTFYGNATFALVNGSEFITGSAAYDFWQTPANNPITFSSTQTVYSNLTPDEDLRLISENKDTDGNVLYLGIADFKPSTTNFPLTIHSYRLGDTLKINTSAITNLPGGSNLTIKATFSLREVDLEATKLAAITGTGGVPNGLQFTWADIVYKPVLETRTVTAGAGDFLLYGGLNKKVVGNIVITITEVTTGQNPEAIPAPIVLTGVAAKGAGVGLKLILATGKIGWYHSGNIDFPNTDITVSEETVPVN